MGNTGSGQRTGIGVWILHCWFFRSMLPRAGQSVTSKNTIPIQTLKQQRLKVQIYAMPFAMFRKALSDYPVPSMPPNPWRRP